MIHWKRIPSNFQERPILGQVAAKEVEALKALSCVGLITSRQMFNLYGLTKKKLKRMVERHRIVPHELVLNEKHRITVYSLGVNGAKIAEMTGYEVNYWVRFQITDVLKRLLFFSFYERVYPSKLELAHDPFIAKIYINNNPMYVYVARGALDDIMMYLKWNEFNERLIIITESLSHLQQLKPFLQNIKLRVILDSSILNKEEPLINSFYLLENNEFRKENRVE